MYQQSPQQNYQQYAPQYPGQNPPQYSQQMLQYPQQQYQVAPPGSQYATHAPSGYPMAPPQPAMMNGFGRGPDGLNRGQRPPNPCICFKCCCGGTCSLRTGVIVIGIANILGLFGQVVRAQLLNIARSEDPARFSPHAYELLYIDGVIFWLVSGILMLIGALCLEATSCLISGVLTFIGGLFHLCMNIYIATNIPSYPQYMGDSAGTYIQAVAGCLFRFYFGYCAYALGKQIRNGEYTVGMPQPMMGVQPAFAIAPIAANNAQPNPPQMAVQIADNKEE